LKSIEIATIFVRDILSVPFCSYYFDQCYFVQYYFVRSPKKTTHEWRRYFWTNL